MHKIFESLILDTDSYKISHWEQYPKGTEYVYSYIEPRVEDKMVVSMGAQSFIKEYLTERITKEDVDYAEKVLTLHGMKFNRIGWMDIVRKHDGFLPISIKALPDGTVFQSHNAQVALVNTDPSAYWLTSYVETALLRSVWYQSTVATISRNVKISLKICHEESSNDPIDVIDFKLHDFGSRGASSKESAMLGGMSHLVNFKGTDTIGALIGVMKYYGDVLDPKDVAGFSIPASEHSTMTSWGKDYEVDAYRNMIKKYGGEGKIVACVSDSWDFINAVDNIWGNELKEEVLASGGTLVIRPDSGDPVIMVMYALNSLWENFGGTVNSKGFKVLNPAVRIIQGDGLDPNAIDLILSVMLSQQWSTDNIAFGMGGGLLQNLNRDTLKYAMKCSAMSIDGNVVDVYKDPATDAGKRSKCGVLSTHFENGVWSTDNEQEGNEMIEMFRCGRVMNMSTFEEVRERAKI